MGNRDKFVAAILSTSLVGRTLEFVWKLHLHGIVGEFCITPKGTTLGEFKGWTYQDVQFEVFFHENEQGYRLDQFCGEEETNKELERLIERGMISLTYESTEKEEFEPEINQEGWFSGSGYSETWEEILDQIPTAKFTPQLGHLIKIKGYLYPTIHHFSQRLPVLSDNRGFSSVFD